MKARKSLKEQVYNKILDKIVKNELQPDQFLTEANLAEEYGASRAPIREALIELCNENILRNIPRTGYQIIQLTPKAISDVIHTRVILEVGGAKKALPKISEEDLKYLENLINCELKYPRKIVSLAEWWKDNKAFHLRISERSGNVLLTQMTKKTIDILWRATAQFLWDQESSAYLNRTSGNHISIVESIKEKNEKRLIEAITEDILSLKKLFQVP